MRIAIDTVTAYEGEAYHYTNEDGYPAGVPIPTIAATTQDGRTFIHTGQTIRQDYDEDGCGPYIRFRYNIVEARALADKIFERGMIDPDHWYEAEREFETVEDRFAHEYELECNERGGI
jgi:hypothetical protein